jgi:hypothetical protein
MDGVGQMVLLNLLMKRMELSLDIKNPLLISHHKQGNQGYVYISFSQLI